MTKEVENSTQNEKRDIAIKNEVDDNFLKVFGQESYPASLKKGIDEVMDLVNNNQTIPDLYPEESQEIPVSQSSFQDICVQFNIHYTSHRKMRQILLQLDGKLGALDNAKNNHKKSYVKLQSLEEDISTLREVYDKLEEGKDLDNDDIFTLTAITYTIEDEDNKQVFPVLSENIANKLEPENISSKKKNLILQKLTTALGYKMIKHEETKRSLKSHKHMIKDSAIKCHQLRKQAKQYREEIEQSDLSYEESEVIYYVYYFTFQAEQQLRTGDHQIDRGTFGAISQLPWEIRKKVFENISFIRKKLFQEEYPIDGDYICHVYDDIIRAKKTDENEIEGMNVEEFVQIEPFKLITTDRQTEKEDNKQKD